MPKLPQAKSVGEEALALHCRVDGLTPVREFKFHPERKWRADFFFAPNLLVEIEGLGGRHQTMGGFRADIAKYNQAAMLGYRVLRYTTSMVMSGEAIEEIKSALNRAKGEPSNG